MRIKGRRYREGQMYCDVCGKECSPYFYCSTRCSDLAREYGRKKAKEMVRNG